MYMCSVLKNIYYHCEVDLNCTNEIIRYVEIENKTTNNKQNDVQQCYWLNMIKMWKRFFRGELYCSLQLLWDWNKKTHSLQLVLTHRRSVSFWKFDFNPRGREVCHCFTFFKLQCSKLVLYSESSLVLFPLKIYN